MPLGTLLSGGPPTGIAGDRAPAACHPDPAMEGIPGRRGAARSVTPTFYQLVRQQLLAAGVERSGEGAANMVRVVHLAPKRNEAFHGQLSRRSHCAAGATVLEVWQLMQRWPDQSIRITSAELLACDQVSGLRLPGYAR